VRRGNAALLVRSGPARRGSRVERTFDAAAGESLRRTAGEGGV